MSNMYLTIKSRFNAELIQNKFETVIGKQIYYSEALNLLVKSNFRIWLNQTSPVIQTDNKAC